MEGMTKHPDIVDYGYRATAERRERLLAASSPAVRARILGKPAAWGAGDAPELQGLRGEIRELARRLRSLAAEVEQLRQERPQPAPSRGVAIAAVAARAGYRIDGDPLTLGELQSHRRGRAWSRPRMVAMWLCSQVATDTTLPKVGACFARDYSTVVNARREIGRVLKLEPALRTAALATCRALSVEAPAGLEAEP